MGQKASFGRQRVQKWDKKPLSGDKESRNGTKNLLPERQIILAMRQKTSIGRQTVREMGQKILIGRQIDQQWDKKPP